MTLLNKSNQTVKAKKLTILLVLLLTLPILVLFMVDSIYYPTKLYLENESEKIISYQLLKDDPAKNNSLSHSFPFQYRVLSDGGKIFKVWLPTNYTINVKNAFLHINHRYNIAIIDDNRNSPGFLGACGGSSGLILIVLWFALSVLWSYNIYINGRSIFYERTIK